MVGRKKISAKNLDAASRKILNIIQTSFPLEERPFKVIGGAVGVSEANALARVRFMKKKKYIRQISAIFDAGALGYSSALVALKVSPKNLRRAARIINSHPGVSHNYERDHEYNLWFTLAVSPDSAFGLDETIKIIRKMTKAEKTLFLPALSVYKIGVHFDFEEKNPAATHVCRSSVIGHRSSGIKLTEIDKKIVRALQEDIPLVLRPFEKIAKTFGIGVKDLLAGGKRFLKNKVMRRFSAILFHRNVGYGANVMGAWAVKGKDADRIGKLFASFKSVSHCYRRPVYSDWRYSVFTMVHGKNKKECEAVFEKMAKKAKTSDYAMLYTVGEFKKARVRYFTPEEREWERKHANS